MSRRSVLWLRGNRSEPAGNPWSHYSLTFPCTPWWVSHHHPIQLCYDYIGEKPLGHSTAQACEKRCYKARPTKFNLVSVVSVCKLQILIKAIGTEYSQLRQIIQVSKILSIIKLDLLHYSRYQNSWNELLVYMPFYILLFKYMKAFGFRFTSGLFFVRWKSRRPTAPMNSRLPMNAKAQDLLV